MPSRGSSHAEGPWPPADAGAEDVGYPATTEDDSISGTIASCLFAAALLVLALGAMFEAFRFPTAAARLPRLVTVPLVGLAAVNLLRELAGVYRLRRGSSRRPLTWRTVSREAEPVIWFLAYSAGVFVLGYTVATVLLLIGFTRLYGHKSWRLTLALTIGVILVIWGAFSTVFNVPLYGGLLGLGV